MQGTASFPKAPKDLKELPQWIKNYLTSAKGKKAYRAHQFTINGVTYPFVRDFHFAATPDPINRRHSMYAGLFLTRPGDLLFFYQSDPQWSIDNINSRRGLRGIYRILSAPFTDPLPIKHPVTQFEMLGVCPNCNTFHANLADKCIKCGQNYPTFDIPSRAQNDPYHLLVLSCRIDIEPLVIFERAISDERAYADMSDDVMLWIGRHDNQMGKGKGSSIRQLLPEEAAKLTRMLANEPGQTIATETKKAYPHAKQPIKNDDSTPGTDLLIEHRPRAGHRSAIELSLNFHLVRTIDNPNSNIANALKQHLDLEDLEYVSSEFPWGYTAGTSDFVFALANEKGRYKIVVLELKKGPIDDYAIIQVSIYVQWVVQIMCQYAQPSPNKITVVPVVIGNKLKPGTCRPKHYSYDARFNSGASMKVNVESPIYIDYVPIQTYRHGDNYYAKDIDYKDKSDRLPVIDWKPPKGVVSSQIEKDWLYDNSWKEAKRNADSL